MKLYEYMAKDILARAGVAVPRGRLVSTAQQAADACQELGPVVIKAQVLAGGRGKAGGIKFAAQPADAAEAARLLLGSSVQGQTVERLLCEQKLDIARELYVAVSVDGAARQPVLIASAQGGVNIEDVPAKSICRRRIDLPWGLFGYTARDVARRIGLEGETATRVVDIMLRMYAVFRRRDAELVETNPLAALVDGAVVAVDARLNVDDDALYRHRDLPAVDEGTELERRVRSIGLSFVELSGDIAVMANGAGMAMATLDIIQRYGGRPANFLDVGGGAAGEPMAQALTLLLSRNPRAVLVNIFGGITRCDDVARAILEVKRQRGIHVPLVVRLSGTNEAAAVAMLKAEGIAASSSMEEAASRVVALAGEVQA
jgi:succinyl-CoA synthetase beta subunit